MTKTRTQLMVERLRELFLALDLHIVVAVPAPQRKRRHRRHRRAVLARQRSPQVSEEAIDLLCRGVGRREGSAAFGLREGRRRHGHRGSPNGNEPDEGGNA